MVLVVEVYCSSNFKDSINIPVECITIFGCIYAQSFLIWVLDIDRFINVAFAKCIAIFGRSLLFGCLIHQCGTFDSVV